MISRPSGIGAFQFVILASLRSMQLARGCRPRIDGDHKNAVIAQLEILQGKVLEPAVAAPPVPDTVVVVPHATVVAM